jgi:GWxTD domain-containing protein
MLRSRLAALLLTAGGISLIFGLQYSAYAQDEQLRAEEAQAYFKKWLEEDVVYVITREEKEIFQKLNNDEEKERFIEQFWFRRDPDPSTAINEFKEEHYRRIAYANERYESGEPGWKTDRGRIYIIQGPPDQIEPHPTGGPYDRPLWEGGGYTVSFPFEVWRYHHIDGVGDDVLIEFVDPGYTGEYHIARNPDEKDAFYNVPTLGLTMDEAEGFVARSDRGTPQDMRYYLRRDNPFDRYRQYVMVQRPAEIKYKDLQQAVQISLSYDELPVRVQFDQFRLGEDRMIVPLTFEIENSDLTLVDRDGRMTADVAIYGQISSLSGQIINEFEDELVVSVEPGEVSFRPGARSIYQKTLVLEARSRYKANLVFKDLNASKISVIRRAIVPERFESGEGLAASSIILSDAVRSLPEVPKKDEMFVLGDLWIRPNLARRFQVQDPLAIYLQVYNAAFDQASGLPKLAVRWELFRGDQSLGVIEETRNESIYYASEARVVVLRSFPIGDLGPGKYRIRVLIQDQIKDSELSLDEDFQVG